MKPYLLIEGNHEQLEEFENKIASALEAGYALAGDLKIKVLHSHQDKNKIVFFQALIWDEEDFEEEDFEEEDEAF